MKRNVICRCTALLSIFLTPYLSARENDAIKNYIHLGKKDGIVNNHVTALSDDIYGRIWIGTAKGLNIYDSRHLSTVGPYAGSYIYALYDTGKEMLVATQTHLDAYDYESGTYSRLQHEGKDLAFTMSVFPCDGQHIIVADGSVYGYGEDRKLRLLKSDVGYEQLCIDKFGMMWGLHRDRVYKIDARFEIVKSYRLSNHDQSPLISICLYPDSKGTVWIGTIKDGLYRYNRAFDDFRKEDLRPAGQMREIENINSIHEDRYDRLWIGHNSGVVVYDYNDGYFKNHMFENSYDITLTTTVTKIFRTKSRDMALGTFFTGFFYVNDLHSNIRFSTLGDWSAKTGLITANGIVKDPQKRLWVGTNCMGISVLDENGKVIRHINHGNAPINDNIVSLERDARDNIWAGSLSNGLYKIEADGRIQHYIHQPDDVRSLSGSKVFALHALGRDSLLVASNKGLDVYLYDKNGFSNLISATQEDYAFTQIHEHGDDIYASDLYTIFRFNRKSGQVTPFIYPQYRDNHFQCSYADGAGRLWLGTAKGELLLFERDSLRTYLSEEKLGANSIADIQGDSRQQLWLASGNKLIRISPEKKIQMFNLAWGMGDNEFNVRSSYTDKDGRIYFGTTDGLIHFHPQELIIQEKRNPVLYISDFLLSRNAVAPGASELLQKHINHTTHMTLDSHQNSISFRLSFIDFPPDGSIPLQCVYRLEGVDHDWNELNPASPEISYAGLRGGKYVFNAQIITEAGESIASKRIELYIKPPFLLRWYMILFYFLLLCGIIGFIDTYFARQRETKEIINRSKREQEELTRLNAMKLDFFTFISHEFKTPLSIISTLQNEIIPDSNETDSDVSIFKRSVKRLEFLINQLMDFRNMDSGHTSVKREQYDAISFIRETFEAFIPLYKQKEIAYRFESEIETLPMLFDSDKLEMLFGNLLSNTVKHTREGGNCHLKIRREGDELVVDIFNSGTCLSEEQKVAIFQPYYRTDSSGEYPNSGIGLALVNSIVQLLDINLTVLPIKNEGNLFRLRMPISRNDEIQMSAGPSRKDIVNRIIDNTLYIEEQTNLLNEYSQASSLVLIVDNDSDTRKMLRKKLQERFQILTAASAKDALLLLKSHHPDVIISDVFMPEIDGFEFCRRIKNNPQLHHIPVFLITSDISGEIRLKGIQAGADIFLQKPLNIQELTLHINNIVKRKNVLRDFYAGFQPLNIDQSEVNNADEIFIKKLTGYINDNLSNPDLSVQQLVEHTNISRTKLYLNVKRLTGLTPSQLILDKKMEQARQLLHSTSLTASEISYRLGYCSPNHFSRQFKEYYRLSPGEFRKKGPDRQ